MHEIKNLDKILNSDYQIDKFTKQLTVWYDQNKRDLPWRQSIDPYRVWLSEIMLQQTRVDQALGYYLKFIEAFPTLSDLAHAKEDKVLKMWQGLGYYSRARNLHFASKQILKDYKGKFPNTSSELKKIKGIGEYTAAAIASICFNEKTAAIDGNFYRLFSRFFGIETAFDSKEGKSTFYALANQLCPSKNPGDFNQAVMDFAATVCTPKLPLCTSCVFAETCYANRHQMQQLFPVKSKKTKVFERKMNYVFLTDGKYVLFRKREGEDIWKGLHEPLLFEEEDVLKSLRSVLGKKVNLEKILSKKHLLSHRVIHAEFYFLAVDALPEVKTYKKVKLSDIYKLPVSRLVQSFIESQTFVKRLGEI